MRVRATQRMIEAGSIYGPGDEFTTTPERARQLGDLVVIAGGEEAETAGDYRTTALTAPAVDRQMRPARRSRRKVA